MDIHVLNLGVLTWQVRILCTDFVVETWNLFSYGIIEHGMFPCAPSTNMAINTSVAINPFFSESRKRIFPLPFRGLSQDHLFFLFLCRMVGTKNGRLFHVPTRTAPDVPRGPLKGARIAIHERYNPTQQFRIPPAKLTSPKGNLKFPFFN